MNLSPRNDSVDHLPWSVMLRFGTVLLACVLLAMSAGASLTLPIANLCYLFGLSGMAFYFCLELAADYRAGSCQRANSSSAEQRLTRRVRAENSTAKLNSHVLSAEDSTDNIERAMDSHSDLAVFLGAQTQPTLSV